MKRHLGLASLLRCDLKNPLLFKCLHAKNIEYDQEMPQLQTADKTCGYARKRNTTIMRHHEVKLGKAFSSLFPIKMIAKQEWTQSWAQQNIEQFQNPTMGAKINKEVTTTEPLQQNYITQTSKHV